MDCIFCKIIAREVKAAKVYEDDDCYAFLDLFPINPGHTLVIPKQHVSDFLDMDPEAFASVSKVAQRIGRAVKAAANPPRVGMLIKGFDVPHVHLHLIPMLEQWELVASKYGKSLPPQGTPDYFEEMVKKVEAALDAEK